MHESTTSHMMRRFVMEHACIQRFAGMECLRIEQPELLLHPLNGVDALGGGVAQHLALFLREFHEQSERGFSAGAKSIPRTSDGSGPAFA